ncbi:MAG: hypothetical protein HDR37_03965 [Treponema sp.]|nr:hypothetical protein [Treponema sp.]
MSEKSNITMTEEVAMAEVRRWAELNEIDLTVKNADGERVMDGAVAKLAAQVQNGRLVLNEDGEFVYTVSAKSPAGYAGEQITFHAPTGAAYMGMDGFKDTQSMHKLMAVASAMTGKDIAWFAKLSNGDYKVVQNIVGFFIAG